MESETQAPTPQQQIAWAILAPYPLGGMVRVQLASEIAKALAEAEECGAQRMLAAIDHNNRTLQLRNSSMHLPGCTCDLCREARHAE